MERTFHIVNMPSETSGTQAIERAAQLLVRVVEAPSPPSIGELAGDANLPKSTTSRLVAALERQGLVQRLGDRGRVRPGPVLLRFADRDGTATLIELARPSLAGLAAASGETINLAVPGPDGVEHLAQEDTAHLVGVTDWVGRRVPFDQAANGKCFLAFGLARRRHRGAAARPRARLGHLDRRARGRPLGARRARHRRRRRRRRRPLASPGRAPA